MYKLIRRVPEWVDGRMPPFIGDEDGEVILTHSFKTQEEALNVDRVRWFKDSNCYGNFYRYSISDDLLIAEYNKGYVWFVVASSFGDDLKLPTWKPRYKFSIKRCLSVLLCRSGIPNLINKLVDYIVRLRGMEPILYSYYDDHEIQVNGAYVSKKKEGKSK